MVLWGGNFTFTFIIIFSGQQQKFPIGLNKLFVLFEPQGEAGRCDCNSGSTGRNGCK